MQDEQHVRWGLAGYGDLPQRRLVDALNRLPNRLSAIWGRSAVRAAAFAAQFGIPRAAGTLHELMEDVDAVYVAVPPAAHIPVAKAAVQAGRHVLIEKPLSPTFDGYADLSALISNTGVKAAVAYYRRFAPAVRRLRHLLAAAELGRVVSIDLTYTSPFLPRQDDPKAWRLDRAVAGGGVMADTGSHRLDLLCWLFGPAEVLSARIIRSAAGMAERGGDMTLRLAAGVSAHCRFSWDEPKSDRLVISGDKATVTMDPLDGGRLVIETSQGTRSFEDPPPPNLHVDLVQAFCRSVLLGSMEDLCTLSEARAVDAILETAYGLDPA